MRVPAIIQGLGRADYALPISIPNLCVPGREMHCGTSPIRFMVPDPGFLRHNRAEFDKESEKWVIRERGLVVDYFYYIPAMWGLRIGT
jgi:hypothetical protein